MILVIDNYDSFTYNLVQYLRMLGEEVLVKRNDEISAQGAMNTAPDRIVISPGPGGPESAGVTLKLIEKAAGNIPILGVCLGHQCIAHAFGGTIVSAKSLMHGKTSMVEADGKGVFSGIKSPFQAMRYHSLAVEEATLPDCLEISARAEDGEIMGLRHREFCVEGIQFHPESIMTPAGKRMLRNFCRMDGHQPKEG
ncbi:MAG: aminodeoxychorismate/anthranilate synthase component II [Deltaproteobacteria bacterium]|nr:aminodeoxychorismate/anthranilate synthase component II [Deltaproteobacteria bacterium]